MTFPAAAYSIPLLERRPCLKGNSFETAVLIDPACAVDALANIHIDRQSAVKSRRVRKTHLKLIDNQLMTVIN